MKIEIPILRWGEVYRSLDTVTLETGGGAELVTHTANPGLIRRDLLRVREARAALEEIPAETLADYCEAAAEIFLNDELPLGDATQSPDDYVEALSSVTRLPHTLVRMNMSKIHAAMSQIRTVIGGLTRGMPLEIFDRGITSVGGLDVNYYPATSSLGVALPSNAPAVNSLWIPALVMKIPVLLKPGREDPFTPLRIVQAMIQAGFLGQLVYLGATALGLGACGIGAIYDDEAQTLLGLSNGGVLGYLVAAGIVKRTK